MLRLAFVTGTEPGKWFQRFQDNTAHGGLSTIDADDSMAELLAGRVDLALTRLPDARLDDSFHVVRLYEEAPGVAVPKDSVYAEVGEALALADVSDEHLNYRLTDAGEVDIAAVREALQVVAANVGIAIAPLPLLKILSKKQVVPLALKGSDVPITEIALVWRKAEDSEAIQDLWASLRAALPVPLGRKGRNERLAKRLKLNSLGRLLTIRYRNKRSALSSANGGELKADLRYSRCTQWHDSAVRVYGWLRSPQWRLKTTVN